jgi:ferritin-like metal-binding protein YciE
MKKPYHTSGDIQLGPDRLQKFFINNLDRIYCAKKHMVDRFPEIAEQAYFSDLSHAITETVDDVKKQIVRMDEIYKRLGAENSITGCTGLAAMIEEAFVAINGHKDDTALRDMAILFYMQNMESIEVASFQVLQMMAVKLKDPEIQQLLKENFDEAKEDRVLLLMITAKYITS